MANIDTTRIEGYAAMTPEQKLAALEAFQIPDPVDLTGYVKKDVFDKKATEAAAASKELKTLKDAALTDEQRRQQEKQDFENERLAFNKERNATKIKGIFGAAGLKPEQYSAFDLENFSDETAAVSFANGIVGLLSAQKSAAEQQAKNDLLGGKKPPEAGGGPDKAAAIKSEYAEAQKSGNSQMMVRCIREAQELGVSLF